MKRNCCSFLTLVLLCCCTVEAAPREFLHLVYVTNRDRAPLPDYEGRVNRMMVDVQDFFREEMERNGYGGKTFRLDLDEIGQARVHLVTLDWDFDPERKFTPRDLRPFIKERLSTGGIDIEQEYMVVFENVYWKDGQRQVYDMVYTGVGDPVKGATWVADHEWLDPDNMDPARTERINDRGQRLGIGQFNVKMIGGVAHEFGHGLGLPHNKQTDAEFRQYGTALMGAGNYTYRRERLGKKNGSFLTEAHAFILSLHPLFTHEVPGGFTVPENTFPEELSFHIEDGNLKVSGRAVPGADVAGVVLYHDPLPSAINKDYDAFSYLADMDPEGRFSAAMPMLAEDAGCALLLKIYMKNGMHRAFRFEHGNDDPLKDLRAEYIRILAMEAFRKKDVDRLRALVKEDSSAPMKLFLRLAEQWDGFKKPSEVEQADALLLSSSRWESASVGWYVPSFNGVLEPDGKWYGALATMEGRCPDGLYAHAPSAYVYSLGGTWEQLSVRIGLQKGRREGSVIFIVKGDGKELFRSETIRARDGEISVDVDIAGIETLELITETGSDGANGDWGLWISPTVRRR